MPLENSELDLTLEELEGSAWGEPEYPSSVVVNSHALRKQPLKSLANEQLRLAISQRIGIPFILDVAFRRLEENPLLCGDNFEGDVLVNLKRLPDEDWEYRPQLKAHLATQIERALKIADEHERMFLERRLKEVG